ncbi:hypothetical protein [Listeria monocytogenes]|uniref:hypothetical protein n=1 Tax=Listeria monocytogenes TaxID=1639 RepID=UPI000E6C0F32|nr:hypothetical protein [Listeria monocytogenes]
MISFIAVVALALVFIGVLAMFAIIGVIITIPLLKKASKMLLSKKEASDHTHSHGGTSKNKCPAFHSKLRIMDIELLADKSVLKPSQSV